LDFVKTASQVRLRLGIAASKMDHDFLGESAVPPTYTRTYGGNAAFHNFHNDYSHIQDANLRRRLALSEVGIPSWPATWLSALWNKTH
jgi:hypothetical protein